jgi:DNA-binding PadR family transcriptional regulator
MLKAFLDVVILQALEHGSATAYRVDKHLLDRFNAKLSPGVTYTKLESMEKSGLVKCRLHNGKTYSLTEKGKKILSHKPLIIQEIHTCSVTLFESH